MATARQLHPLCQRLRSCHVLLNVARTQAVPLTADDQQRFSEGGQQFKPARATGRPLELGPSGARAGGPCHITHQPGMPAARRAVMEVVGLDLSSHGVRALAAPKPPQRCAALLTPAAPGLGIAGDHGQALHPALRAPKQLQRPQATQREAGQEKLFRQPMQDLLRPDFKVLQPTVVQHDHACVLSQGLHLALEQACVAQGARDQHQTAAPGRLFGLLIRQWVHTRAHRGGRSDARAGWPARHGRQSFPCGTGVSSIRPPSHWPRRSAHAGRCRS